MTTKTETKTLLRDFPYRIRSSSGGMYGLRTLKEARADARYWLRAGATKVIIEKRGLFARSGTAHDGYIVVETKTRF